MVTIVANEAITTAHMAHLGTIADTGPGNMHNKTATGLIFTQGSIDFVFTGSGIHYIAGFPISGTIAGLDIRHEGASAYKITNFNVSVAQATGIWLASDPASAIVKYFMGADHFTGSNFADVLAGFGGNDYLNGRGSADHIAGGAGNDILLGGGGNDILSGGAGKDTLDGGPGSDTADYSEKTAAVSVVLNGPTFANVRVGGVIEDKVKNIENVTGGTAADHLTGDSLANLLSGKGGNDVLNGGDGNDRLLGGAGADRFVFDHALDANRDTIVDFVVGIDKIVLDHLVFMSLSAGALDAGQFVIGSASEIDDFIIYDQTTGALSYDADGSGGGAAAVQFATLANLAALSSADFLVA